MKAWFKELEALFHTWPPQGPNLNPIEKLWDVLQKALFSSLTLPPPKQDLGEK